MNSKVLTFTFIISISAPCFGKVKVTRSIQEVNFSEMSLKGTIRSPDGAYLVQRKGLKFMPLYQIKKDFDQRIRQTSFEIK